MSTHSSTIFKTLNIAKFPDLVSQNIAIFMHKYHYQHLRLVFQKFFDTITTINSYNTREKSHIIFLRSGQIKLWNFQY